MSEEERRIRKAAGRTGGYSRSVLADDLRVVIAELDALRLRTAGGEASQGEGDDSYMTPAQLRDHIQDLIRQRADEATAPLREALEQSVELQSHYAGLLNMYDGGQRLTFASIEAWLDRLAALKDKP